MKYTGVFLSEEEREEMAKLSDIARKTSCFGFSSEQVLSGNDFSSLAHKHMFSRLTELAKAHGLPDIRGEYGLSKDGELIIT